MRPQYHQLPFSIDSSFLFMSWECDYFNKPWHFHQEYELALIVQSEGTLFLGDHVRSFKEGDLVLIGPNIPHLFRNNEPYYEKKGLVAKSIFIHFTDTFLGQTFFDLPEMKYVKKLLAKSSLGLEITGNARGYVRDKLIKMQSESSTGRLLGLLDILTYLSRSENLKNILSNGFTSDNAYDADRINTVFQYIMKNFTKEIYVEEVASKLNMCVGAFSRFFKHHTRKTFSTCVTEIRISYACRLLLENNHNITEICYLSGFENLSNYYRHFKKHIGINPKEYRERFLSGANASEEDRNSRGPLHTPK